MNLVFLVEEKSMKVFLDHLLPRILPPDVFYRTIPHEGKNDLEKSIPTKLAHWNTPDTKFMIIHDQDCNDCRELKDKLLSLTDGCNKKVVIRIACHELESWYFGDLNAVSVAYNVDLRHLSLKSKYRDPDRIESPKQELKKYVPNLEQISGARKISPLIDLQHNTSKSFNMFLSGVEKLINL